MYKFILITFGFLGFAFYQMSGGAEFEPASARLQAAAPIVTAEVAPVVEPREDTAEPQVQATAFVDTDPPLADDQTVTRVSLNLTRLDTGAEEAVSAIESAVATAITEETPVPENVALDTSAATTAIIPSLIDPNDGVDTATVTFQQDTQALDLRTVTGNRVNVRSGPGTNFGVVNKLVQGDEVEILEDNGNGWVKLRPIGDGPIGWMADFLLTSG